MKRIKILMIVSAIAFGAFAGTFKLSVKEQSQITEEAENWIDDMPAGLEDRLSDAVLHAMHGFSSEIEAFRNYNDTTGIGKYSVVVKDLKGGTNSDISMRFYSSSKTEGKHSLLIFFHGGGWSMGSLNSSDMFCRALASEGNVNVISVEYPLAPENPFPAAINICKDAVKYICSKAVEMGSSPNLISLGGEGAGGNLVLATYESLSDDIAIKSLILYYPFIKTTGTLNPEMKRKFGRGYGFDSRLWEVFVEAYQGKEVEFKKLLPPTLMISAGRDIIYDEATDFVSNHKGIEFVEFEGGLHGFLSDGQQKTAFNKAVEITDSFLNSLKE